MSKSTINQFGDTIVEVLIAMAVVSTVLVGAFIVTQRSVSAVRTGQEHAEALQQMQGQVELVRALALQQTSDSGGVFQQHFCIDSSDPANIRPVADTSTACTLNSLYKLSASYDTTSSDKRFNFTAMWDKLGGGVNTEKLVYRIYPGKLTLVGGSASPVPAPVTIPTIPGTPEPDPVPGTSLSASIDDPGCSRDDSGNCVTPATEPQYRWTRYLRNTTSNNGLTVQSCVWDWGDGQTSAAACNYSEVASHPYQPFNVKPYPESCRDFTKKVKLTVNYTNKQRATAVYEVSVPNCY